MTPLGRVLSQIPHPGDESIHDTLMVRSPQAKVGSESVLPAAQVSALPTCSAFKTGTFISPLLLRSKPNVHYHFLYEKKRGEKKKNTALDSGKGF